MTGKSFRWGWAEVAYFFQTSVIGFDLYIVSPLLPVLARQFHVSLALTGYFVTIFALSYAAASPVLGRWSDRAGRRQVAMLSLAVFSLAAWGTALASNYGVFLAMRALAGLGAAGFTPVLYAYIADRVPYDARGRAMSFASAGLSFATFLGVPLGIVLAADGHWSRPFFLIGWAGIVSFFMVKRGWEPNRLRPSAVRWAGPRPIIANLLLTGAVFLSSGMVYTYLPAYLVVRYRVTSWELAGLLAVFGLGNVLGTFALGAVTDRWGKHRTLKTAILGQTVFLFVVILGWPLAWEAVILGGLAFFGGYTPALKAMASHARAHGEALAWNNTALYSGLALGAALGGELWSWGMRAVVLVAAGSLALAWRLVGKTPILRSGVE